MSEHTFQATPIPSNLTFINTTGSKSLSKNAKGTVRGHVTRRVFQERRYKKAGCDASAIGNGGGEAANVSRPRAAVDQGHYEEEDDDFEEDENGKRRKERRKGKRSGKALTFKAYKPAGSSSKASLTMLRPAPTPLERRKSFHFLLSLQTDSPFYLAY
jgi:hypothetical protein